MFLFFDDGNIFAVIFLLIKLEFLGVIPDCLEYEKKRIWNDKTHSGRIIYLRSK